MDANLANAILENVDSAIYQIFQRCIPLITVVAWTEAQEQVDGQLTIASQVVDSATSVPSLVIATKMFWRGKDQGWPDWNKIVGCPSELLRCHLWYRPTTTIPLMNATLDPPTSNNETAVRLLWNVGGWGGERTDALPRESQDDGIEREDLVRTRTQDAPEPSAETHHFEQTSQTASQSGPPVALRGSEDEERAIDQAETPSNEEDQLDEGPECGRSTTRATSPAN
ncbi:hypothetical protein JVT61DRAFT_3916 [Boletus reticuloceps]|uniref:Uncharacterized protein n=1 Tax=Boletus reticuloceps TaxID=495285 RepID=A0A8I2YMH5_9AGAM|nr:hypothetical protein JVT61DRAFT_3916 [Boletus reticuloceps]